MVFLIFFFEPLVMRRRVGGSCGPFCCWKCLLEWSDNSPLNKEEEFSPLPYRFQSCLECYIHSIFSYEGIFPVKCVCMCFFLNFLSYRIPYMLLQQKKSSLKITVNTGLLKKLSLLFIP